MLSIRCVRWMVVLGWVIGVGAVSVGAREPHGATRAGSAEFEWVKSLAGKWQGTVQEGNGQSEPAMVEYQVTSGGSAVVETLFAGTPHEMVSVYHDHNGKLMMTHYCMLGNQPQLRLTGADAHQLSFSLAKGSGIDAVHDQHMHALSLHWTDPDHVTQVWTGYEGGKAKEATTIALSRVR